MTSRDEWPSRSDLAEELAWAEYLRTYDQREFGFYSWCYEQNMDPESLDAALAYEQEWILERESRDDEHTT